MNRMLLFSDLHLSPRTYDTCIKVLRRVNKEALQRSIPVGFLGDFFDKVHSQGTLPVDILNELMRFFETEWSVPMVMIPGNHDYFDAAETEHGLTPFSYASKHITVLDEPTVLDGCLWVPWRRNPSKISEILGKYPNVNVIFGHFDIVGFKMSHSQVSTEGVQVKDFPGGIPIYSGHYHTPQVHGNIRYLGSPYQLTLAEAEDKKSLVVLNGCTVAELIPIDIGAHQYRWSAEELLSRASILRNEDRVSVEHSDSISIDALLHELKERGVTVQVKRKQVSVETRISDGQKMSYADLMNEYANIQGVDTNCDAWKIFENKMTETKHEATNLHMPQVRPLKMVINGFGPFAGPVHMALEGRGFNLISGMCDNSKTASNGAGKSILTAGAWLWSLTGMLDGRAALPFDMDVSVVNQDIGNASIYTYGTVNGMNWEIHRQMSKKKHTLKFNLDGCDKTRSTLSGTQKMITRELFGFEGSGRDLYGWLVRNCVWSQQLVTRWLDASDTAAKAEIHKLANVDIWVEMNAWAKLELKDANMKLNDIRLELKHTNDNYDNAMCAHARNVRMASEWEISQARRLSDDLTELGRMQRSYDSAMLTLGEKPEPVVDSELRRSKDALIDAKVVLNRMKDHKHILLKGLPSEWLNVNYDEKELHLKNQEIPDTEQLKIREDHCLVTKKTIEAQLEQAKNNYENFKSAGVCSACQRPFDKDEHHHDHLRKLHETLEYKRSEYVDANTMYIDAKQKFIRAKTKSDQLTKENEYIQNGRSLVKLEENIKNATQLLKKLADRVERLDFAIDKKKRKVVLYERSKQLCDEIKVNIDAFERSYEQRVLDRCPYTVSYDEITRCKSKLESVSEFEKTCGSKCSQWSSIVHWTGSRGIQTYALEHTVKTLAIKTTTWLRRFFGTEDIRLVACFDEKERLTRYIQYKDHAGTLSGGQWRRVQLAAFMAWRDQLNFPLLIMDEACTSMDISGIRAVQDTLREWCDEDERRTCFFISHEPEQHRDTSVYHNHTRILHKRGRSTIAEEPDAKRQRK
jgi:DNA repair exonuclease SbcCD nuclease subunit